MPKENLVPRWSALTPGMPMRMSRFRFIADAGDNAAGAGAADATGQAGADGADNTDATTDDQTSSTGVEAQNVADLPDWAQTLIKDTRAEAAASRTNAKATAAEEATTAVTEKIGRALGLIKDGDTAPDAEALTAQVAEQQAEARAAKVELAVFKAATPTGADPQALLDSRSFLDSIKDIDPTDTAAITAAITKATTDNPRLKATQAAARSGANFSGGTGEGRSKTPKSLADAVSGAYTGA